MELLPPALQLAFLKLVGFTPLQRHCRRIVKRGVVYALVPRAFGAS